MDDLRIAWLFPERIGRTILPGRRFPGGEIPDLDADLTQLARRARHLVVLVTPAELMQHQSGDIVERGLRQQLSVIWRPLAPDQVPEPWLMDHIAQWARDGPTVFADLSGRGRSAAAMAWSLVLEGATQAMAVTRVRGDAGTKVLYSIALYRSVAAYVAHRAQSGDLPYWTLPTSGLRAEHLPPPNAPWSTHLNLFALSFDGFAYARNIGAIEVWPQLQEFTKTRRLAPELRVDDLRACLFQLQRAWRLRHQEEDDEYDAGPYADEINFAWAAIEAIRERL